MPPLNGQWRSLAELADDPKFLARAAEEFPGLAEALRSPVDRRRSVKLMAAAFAMAGLGGCEWAPTGTLVPAVKAPPNIIPALPNFYATAHLFGGYATGIAVKHFMGRPIKVEGNPQHPASLGATEVFAQAEVLDFYDPDRAWGIMEHGLPATYQRLLSALAAERAKIAERRGLPHSDGRHHIRHARRTARRAAFGLSGGALDQVGARLARQHNGRRHSGLWPACRTNPNARCRRCHCCHRERSAEFSTWACALCARFRFPSQPGPDGQNEPGLCG